MSELASLIQAVADRNGVTVDEIDPASVIAGLDDATINLLWQQIEADEERRKFGRFAALFPDEGPLRRELYDKHVEFFAAGATHQERLFMAGNRVGKTIAGGYETACHLTGQYPDWWVGHRFRRPVKWWVAGDTNETTRDVLQFELLGEVGWRDNRKMMDGSGIVPRETLGELTWKQGVQNLVDTIHVKHTSGGWSTLGMKSFDQGRRAFQGTAKHGIWLDEEVPIDVYSECLIRLMTTRGLLLATFTPLKGLTEMVEAFLPTDLHTR